MSTDYDFRRELSRRQIRRANQVVVVPHEAPQLLLSVYGRAHRSILVLLFGIGLRR